MIDKWILFVNFAKECGQNQKLTSQRQRPESAESIIDL